jgi:hypothetical protein
MTAVLSYRHVKRGREGGKSENYLLLMKKIFFLKRREKYRNDILYFVIVKHSLIKMVNAKKKDILERYRHLLENNLILTDNLLRWFQEKKVLPNFVFDDIKV